MKSIEEIGKIFIEEAKKAIDENIEEFSVCANATLNKAPDAKEKYNTLLQKFKDRLPARGISKEEFEAFLPHIVDYQVDLVPYIINKIYLNPNKKED